MAHEGLAKNREEMGRTVVFALESAGQITFEDLIECQRQRTRLNQVLMDLFEKFDLLLTPTMPTEAFDV